MRVLHTMIARTLHCYSCGAAVSSDKPKCDHCGAAAATWQGEDSNRLCPACQTSMLKGDLHGIALHECTKCLSLWLDTPTFERICRDAEHQATVLGTSRALGAANSIGPVRYLRCPHCRELMHRVNFARCSGVIVDVCRAHGTWFDANELHRIVQFIRDGGMTRSREKEKADLTEERRRLQAARSSPEPAHYSSARDYASGYPLLSEVVTASADLLISFLD